MAFKLVIGTQLDVIVKGEIPDGSGKVPFKFALQMRRMGVEAYRKALAPDSDVLVRDFLLDNALGWREQRLVLDEDNKPAEYSREAFECLLGLVGMEQACFQSYIAALQIVDKAQGRTGN